MQDVLMKLRQMHCRHLNQDSIQTVETDTHSHSHCLSEINIFILNTNAAEPHHSKVPDIVGASRLGLWVDAAER